ncbi:uncharacterized protein LOC130726142 [Lotus japonicus]|uniref:uncharacterized protein LOC130726142 n=1 Tax=Lotus japonicus TaxID=34305 RepID=UPI002586E70E|nr:uncharacterized protein LOC130726142 [Lotus japonicus]XP_057433354.1 uncharacterized protein LOC130726142 [Lotus japonicus]
MGTEFETIEGRITCMLSQLQSECGILHRMVYKNKNQHRRCGYFQRLLKVRRDLRLLQSANLEELVTSCFLVIKGDRPKQKVHLLESLKRRKCDGEKHNFLERLLGAARLLSEMVEAILKAATEISVLFARSFFMGFSVTIMALLARLRVLVQQILLDVVSLFNMVSSLSRKKQSIKISHEKVEVFREFYPVSADFVTLKCVWESDKFILLETKHKWESENQIENSGGNFSVQASGVNYSSIMSILGDDQRVSERVETDPTAREDASHVKDMNTDLLTGSSQIDYGNETLCSKECGESDGTAKPSFGESSQEGGLHEFSQRHSGLKKVAFVSIKNPTSAPQNAQSIPVFTSNVKAFHSMGNQSDQTKDDTRDSLANVLANINAKDSFF